MTMTAPGLTCYRVTVHPAEVTLKVQAPTPEEAAVLAVNYVDGVVLSGFLASQFTTIREVAA